MDIFSSLLTAFGLSASAGLNAYIPLFIVGLLARYTNLITLSQPFDTLTHPWVLVALGVMLVVEFFADKIPVVDHLNDVIGTFLRPAAGAVLFAANTSAVTSVDPVLLFIAGMLVAGSVHGMKATARPVINASTAGLGAPVVSTVEDVVSATVSFGVILMPVLFGLLVFAGFVALFVLARNAWRRARRVVA